MPEKNPESSVADAVSDAWPAAYQAAVDQLRGLGAKEPPKTHAAIRARVTDAARRAFVDAGLACARCSVTIVWGPDRPRVMLELVTMFGQRFGGGAEVDPRLTLGVPDGMPAQVSDEAVFFASVLAEDEARLAKQADPS